MTNSLDGLDRSILLGNGPNAIGKGYFQGVESNDVTAN